MPERLLTAREVGELFGFATGTILDWFEADRLPGFRVGGRAVRFRESEILAWLEVLLAIGLAVAFALVFGLVIAAAIERAKYAPAKPYLEQAEMARTALRSLMARGNDSRKARPLS